MLNYTGCEIGFPLDKWIDTKTGAFHNAWQTYEKDTHELAAELNIGVEYVFDISAPNWFDAYWKSPDPLFNDVSVVDIKFSDERKKSVRRVHPGVSAPGDIRWMRGCRDCRPGDYPDELSRDKSVKTEFLVLGEFSPSQSKKPGRIGIIKLYNKNIAEFCRNNKLDYTTVFWSTLAHESFHAFHYSMFKSAGRQDRWDKAGDRKDRDIIKESLAATVEYIFLINHEGDGIDHLYGRDMRKHLEDSWRRFDVEDYPYSGALGIGGLGLTKIAAPPDMMIRLLDMSLCDWRSAAEIIKTGYYLTDPRVRRMLGAY